MRKIFSRARRKVVFVSICLNIFWSFNPLSISAQNQPGLYARIAFLKPNDGQTVDFESGYIRHLDWHKKAGDTWVWYGWSIWASERQRWFVYATFGHTAESLSNPVSPAEDEKDNIINVTPHCSFMGNSVYKFLPDLSNGNGVPQPLARVEFTTIKLVPGTEDAFEKALKANKSANKDECLWYRIVSGGNITQYVRIRPKQNLALILDSSSEQALPKETNTMVSSVISEILNLRPTMSYGLDIPIKN